VQPVQKEAIADEGRRQCRVPRGKGQGMYGFSQANWASKKAVCFYSPYRPYFCADPKLFWGVFVDVLRANHCTVKKLMETKSFAYLPTLFLFGDVSGTTFFLLIQ